MGRGRVGSTTRSDQGPKGGMTVVGSSRIYTWSCDLVGRVGHRLLFFSADRSAIV